MASTPDARRLAASVVAAVLQQGVFATATLDRALRAAPDLDPRDKALATEITYGTLRTRVYLSQRLRELAKRKLPSAENDVEAHLLVAAYQLLFLDRVPAFAVVDAAVSAITDAGGKSLGGFANAVLRRLASADKPNMDDALLQSAPIWLLQAIQDSVGEDAARALLGCTTGADGSPLGVGALSPPPSVRIRAGAPVPEWLADSPRGTLCPEVYLASRQGDLQQRPEWRAGHYVVQEEGALFCGKALDVHPGATVLDACAGRGQKTSLLSEQMLDGTLGGAGQLWATDVTESKLGELHREFARLHLPKPNTAVVDWTRAADVPENFPPIFDRILVDAPCTGTGTLRHRPEIMLRLKPADVERLAEASEKILRNVAAFAGPQTQVLFVVCSVLRREGEVVVERVGDLYEPTNLAAGGVLQGVSRYRLLPNVQGTDGFFLASLRRKS